ncbi:MAG: nuclear transport factor 2 family protein [Bacteroidota bacterium]
MKVLFSIVISLIYFTGYSQNSAKDNISDSLNKWHKDAASANGEDYFSLMDQGAIFIGTDKTEYWTKEEFEIWSKKYFDSKETWSFKTIERNIYFSSNKKIAWFDELLETWMGICRASGVLELNNEEWRLKHYHLSVTVPNEKIKEFINLTSKN